MSKCFVSAEDYRKFFTVDGGIELAKQLQRQTNQLASAAADRLTPPPERRVGLMDRRGMVPDRRRPGERGRRLRLADRRRG